MNKMKPGELHAMMKKNPMKAYKSAIKMSGMFHGKSNALGHGGRAAQLKARGVPGGVIGNLARAAHAAPGQKNYHGKHAKKKKVAPLEKQELGMAMKRSHKKAAQHIHVHLHMKGSAGLVGQSEEHKEFSGMKREKKAHKHYKKARKGKFGDEKEQGVSKEHSEESADKFKKSHKCKGAMCKHSAHSTHLKKKASKRKASLEGGYANTPAGAGAKARQAVNQTVQYTSMPRTGLKIGSPASSIGGFNTPFGRPNSGGLIGGQSTNATPTLHGKKSGKRKKKVARR